MSIATESTIDFSLWFMPQRLTPLYFTDAYATLTPAQQLRYNQLQALYLHEQITFFERALAPTTLAHFLATDLPPKLRRALEEFAADEARHSEMFSTLNRRAAPALYARENFHFVQTPPLAARLLHFICSHPRIFPLTLWIMHLQEERALSIGREFLKCDHPIEPHFLNAQRAHLADEVSHVHCDKLLLDLVWPKTSRLLRALNVRLLAWLLKEFFGAPKRAQLRVIDALVRDFPELAPRHHELRAALLALSSDDTFLKSLYSRDNVPQAFERFDQCADLRKLARALPGYAPKFTS